MFGSLACVFVRWFSLQLGSRRSAQRPCGPKASRRASDLCLEWWGGFPWFPQKTDPKKDISPYGCVCVCYCLLFVCLFVRLSVHLFVCLFVCLFVYVCVLFFLCLSVCLFLCLFVDFVLVCLPVFVRLFHFCGCMFVGFVLLLLCVFVYFVLQSLKHVSLCCFVFLCAFVCFCLCSLVFGLV